METNQINKTEEKKMWVNPQLILIEKEIIEGYIAVGSDGNGVSTKS